MPNFSNYTGYAVAGLSVFLMWNLLTNHVMHLTKAIDALTSTIAHLQRTLEYGKPTQ